MAGDLAAALAVFDEAALEALANKGLVRRALRDIEENKLSLASSDDDAATVSADGETVAIDRRGPAAARCTCPAPGICRHRLAATLFLRAHPSDAPDDEHAEAHLEAELEALTPDIIAKWAGKAAWRAALDLSEAGGTVTHSGASLVIRLTGDEEDIRFLGGQGLAGMVSKVKPARLKAHHAAAVLVARALAGFATPELEAPAEPDQVRSVDPAFLAEVRAALAQCARFALNLAPVALEDQLFMLAVSSRADSLPRLSRMLRTQSAMLKARRARDFAFDPDAALALIAQSFALTGALGRDPNPELTGSVRQDYAAMGDVALTGMGAEVWRTPAGARGVTAWFHAPALDRWFSASLARAAGQDPGFSPAAAYGQEAVWQSRALEHLARASFRLEGAAASPDGRLSLAKAVRAVDLASRGASSDPAQVAVALWSDLRAHLRDRLTGTLAVPALAAVPVLLAPRRIGRAWFDALRQSLIWPVEDAQGNWIGLSVDHGRDREQLLAAVEAMAAKGWRGTITALASAGDTGFVLKPIALGGGDRLFNLGLDRVEDLAGLSALSQRLRDLAGFRGFAPRAFEVAAPAAPQRALAAAWQALVDLAELGMDVVTADQAARLTRAAADVRAVGLSAVAAEIDRFAASGRDERWETLSGTAFAIRLARQRTLDLPRLVAA